MRILCVVSMFAFLGMSAAAHAADPLGLYVGGSFGSADVRSTNSPAWLTFGGTDLGWDVFVGARPISFAGIEFAYMDFGHATASLVGAEPCCGFSLGGRSTRRASAIFGVGYVPLPVRFLDLYGKVGIARLYTQEHANITEGLYTQGPSVFSLLSRQWSTDVAYGAGVQSRFSSFSIRAEYERIDASGGDPDLFSLGVTWTF